MTTRRGKSSPQPERDEQWKRYWRTRAVELRDALAERYFELVHYVRRRYIPSVPQKVEEADLIQEGKIKLVQCVEEFDPTQGRTFQRYATPRVRGAMLDFLRNDDWVPRSVRREGKALRHAVEAIQVPEDVELSDTALAGRLGISLDEFYDWEHRSVCPVLVSLECDYSDELGDSSGPLCLLEAARDEHQSPYDRAAQIVLREVIHALIQDLPEPYSQVLDLYYFHGMKQKAIAQELEKTAPRICQIHREGIAMLRERLEGTDVLFPEQADA